MQPNFSSDIEGLRVPNVDVCIQVLLNKAATHLEGVEVPSYLASCLAETVASRPGLATNMEEYYFLGS